MLADNKMPSFLVVCNRMDERFLKSFSLPSYRTTNVRFFCNILHNVTESCMYKEIDPQMKLWMKYRE